MVDTITEERFKLSGEQPTDAPGDAVPFRRQPPTWLRRHLRTLVVTDALAAASATLIARVLAFGWGPADLQVRSLQLPYTAAVAATVPAWLVVLATSRCYDVGPFGSVRSGTRRVVRAGAQFLAMIAVGYYVVRFERLGREFLIIIVPLAVTLTLLGRTLVSERLRRLRARGHCRRRALIMGGHRNVTAILDHLARDHQAGLTAVAALVTDGRTDLPAGTPTLSSAGHTDDVIEALRATDADLLLITDGPAPGHLRRLTWRLEGTGVAVLVAPTVAHLAGPHFDVRPVAGLPLLYVDRESLVRADNRLVTSGDAGAEPPPRARVDRMRST